MSDGRQDSDRGQLIRAIALGLLIAWGIVLVIWGSVGGEERAPEPTRTASPR